MPGSDPSRATTPAPPGLLEALALAAGSLACVGAATAVCASFVSRASGYLDNQEYLQIADAIARGKTGSVDPAAHFWGLPYTVALFARVAHVPQVVALAVISISCSLATVWLVYQRWGGKTAAVAAVISPHWLALSVLGGSEPLFVALLIASMLAFRADRPVLATFCAAVGVTVRPVGILALAGLTLALIAAHDRRLTLAWVVIGLVATVYGLALERAGVKPIDTAIAHVRAYGFFDGAPLAMPFRGFVLFIRNAAFSLKVRINGCLWAAICACGVTAGAVRWKTDRAAFPLTGYEIAFGILYLAMLVSLNTQNVLWGMPRYVLPVMPMLVAVAEPWLPGQRWFLYGWAAASIAVASAFATGLLRLSV